MPRSRIPNRRAAWSETFNYQGIPYHVTFGYNGPAIQEVFIVAGKPGSPVEAMARDTGLLLSIALQHGLPLEELTSSMTKLDHGEPAGPLGIILAILTRENETCASESPSPST